MLTVITGVISVALVIQCLRERVARLEAEAWARHVEAQRDGLQAIVDRRVASVVYAIRHARADEQREQFESGCG